MTQNAFRFPAEWEPQDAILLAWPHAGTDWADRLGEVENTYIELVAAITRFQDVLLCVADDDVEAYARARLASARIDMGRVHFVTVPYNDTWLRDSGPITLHDGDDGFRLLDFRFTGWGGKFEASEDDALVARLHDMGVFADSHREAIGFALEGGAIETDGAGTLLTTWACLSERHPEADEATLSAKLSGWLAQTRVLWLHHGYLQGDDTDAHIDTLARFAAPDAIVYQACDDADDAAHHGPLQAMAGELAALETADGTPYRLFPLPWPRPIHDAAHPDGPRRLAASYANFLILNDAVLMPGYGDPADIDAAAVVAQAFPGREIVQIDCRPLIWQNGSLHCLTMQLPRGVLARVP
ncbi:agmatine deiminase family protein [Luteimonas abyssi]|uniref:agmatine deiminase family protein n=1 Tax=Luteimonas abyssi TaxID=1247514 RepID=UPI000737C955|nr:agmatine deiminase family protein [Luteimonas abyssi]